jgi:hypothetical protein
MKKTDSNCRLGQQCENTTERIMPHAQQWQITTFKEA